MALKDLYENAQSTSWQGAELKLKEKLLQAEMELLNYSRNLPENPAADVHSRRVAIAQKRSELWSAAIVEFHRQLIPIQAEAVAGAIIAYLNSNNRCMYHPGSLVALTSPGPSMVQAAGSPMIATITFS